MKPLISQLKQVCLHFTFIACLILLTWVWGGTLINFSPNLALANSLTPEADYYQVDGNKRNKMDIDEAANKAAEASDKLFEGLDTTKQVVGKTEKRNEAIEHARQTASGKLKAQSLRVKSMSDSDELAPNEGPFLKNLEGKN